MELKKAIKERHSARHYTSKKVKMHDIISILDAARHAPAAGNIPTVKLIVVDDAKTKAQLADAALKQDFIAQASYVVVVCSDTTEIVRSYGARGQLYARQQAGAAIQNMLLCVTDLGLASCWVGAFNEDKVKRLLKIPAAVNAEALLPISYEFGKLPARRKPDLDKIVFFGRYGKKELKERRRPPAY